MKIAINRLCLLVLAITAAYTGIWAYSKPESWYANFPNFGLSWLPQLGPYNQHLSKDVGAMYLALTVLSLVALWRVRDAALVRVSGLVWFTFNLLHFVFHMSMLHMYNTLDRVLNVITLSLVIVLSAILLVPGRSSDPSPPSPPR